MGQGGKGAKGLLEFGNPNSVAILPSCHSLSTLSDDSVCDQNKIEKSKHLFPSHQRMFLRN